MEEVVTLISNVGFPIAVCLICFWYINKINEAHKEESSKMTEAINNNTNILTRILEKIGIGGDN